jgi:hypothetical protein
VISKPEEFGKHFKASKYGLRYLEKRFENEKRGLKNLRKILKFEI